MPSSSNNKGDKDKQGGSNLDKSLDEIIREGRGRRGGKRSRSEGEAEPTAKRGRHDSGEDRAMTVSSAASRPVAVSSSDLEIVRHHGNITGAIFKDDPTNHNWVNTIGPMKGMAAVNSHSSLMHTAEKIADRIERSNRGNFRGMHLAWHPISRKVVNAGLKRMSLREQLQLQSGAASSSRKPLTGGEEAPASTDKGKDKEKQREKQKHSGQPANTSGNVGDMYLSWAPMSQRMVNAHLKTMSLREKLQLESGAASRSRQPLTGGEEAPAGKGKGNQKAPAHQKSPPAQPLSKKKRKVEAQKDLDAELDAYFQAGAAEQRAYDVDNAGQQ